MSSAAPRETIFGQVVIGPPGSGKSTYCHAMADFLRAQNRKVAIVNLGNKVFESLRSYVGESI